MFSTKILDKDYSRSFAVIVKVDIDKNGDIKSRKVKETIYHTELMRHRPIDKTYDFDESMSKYIDTNTNGEWKLKSPYEFEIVPHSKPTKSFQRGITVVISPSGGGKSVFIGKLANRYNEVMPDNHILYASANALSNDPAYEELSKKTITKEVLDEETKKLKKEKFPVLREFNLTNIDNTIDVFDEGIFKNTMTIFDDLHNDIGQSFTYQDLDPELTPEKYSQLSITDKNKVNRLVKQKNNMVTEFMMSTAKNIMFLGRKQNISFVFVQHTMFTGNRLENILISEATNLVLFPNRTDPSILSRFLTLKLNFTKKQADLIIKKKWYNYDFCMVDLTGSKRFMVTPDTLKFLQ